VAAPADVSSAGASPPARKYVTPGVPARPRNRRGARRVMPLLLLLVVAALAYLAIQLFQPFGDGDGHGAVAVRIPEGATADEIADLLEEKGVVKSSFFFNLRTRIDGKRDALKAGPFNLRQDMHYGAAIAAITKTPPPPKTIKVTVPEGLSIRETVPLVTSAGLRGSYLKAACAASARKLGAPRSAACPEGFLFPATYELKPRGTAKSLVAQQLSAFGDTFKGVDLTRAKRKNLSRYDIVTIASMVEREASADADRALVAGVIYNRLKRDMPLGIDATIRYERKNWSRPLRVSELERDTPYNTRLHTGLPPTPIGNPGLKSLQAAANPSTKPYLFYVVKPCGNGVHAFSSTEAQFQRDVDAYNAAREKRGGKDPSRC
jgi:uncharacterized YceG family protein